MIFLIITKTLKGLFVLSKFWSIRSSRIRKFLKSRTSEIFLMPLMCVRSTEEVTWTSQLGPTLWEPEETWKTFLVPWQTHSGTNGAIAALATQMNPHAHALLVRLRWQEATGYTVYRGRLCLSTGLLRLTAELAVTKTAGHLEAY